MKPRPSTSKKTEDTGPKYYMLWQTDDQVDDPTLRRVHDPIPAPKMYLPGHEESYNPPPEYLFTEKEKKEWIASISAAFHTLLFLCRENRFCERNISSAFLIGHDSSTIIKEQTDQKRYFCLRSHLWSFQPQFS